METNKLEAIIQSTGVGAFMGAGALNVVELAIEKGQKLSVAAEPFLGPIDSQVIEYGFPGIFGLGAIVLGYTAVKGTYKYVTQAL